MALYQADRTERTTAGVMSLSLMIGAMTYTGLLAANFSEFRSRAYIEALTPLPLWIAASFHVILIAATFTRNKSIELLEQKLAKIGGVEQLQPHLGIFAIQELMGFNRQPRLLKAHTIFVYGGIGLCVFGVTAGCWSVTLHDHGWANGYVIGDLVVSLSYILILILAWRSALKLLVPSSWARNLIESSDDTILVETVGKDGGHLQRPH